MNKENLSTVNLSASDKILLSQKIMLMAKELIQKNHTNEKLADITIDGLPAGVNVMVVASSLGRDAYDYYEKEDGDLDLYLRWFIDSTIKLMTAEFLKQRKPYVIKSYPNLFTIFYENIHHGMTPEGIADMLGIECNETLIRKAAKIYDLI